MTSDEMTTEPVRDQMQNPAPSNRGKLLKILILVVVVAGLFFAGRLIPVQPALDWVGSLGVWGPMAFVGVYIVAAVMLVPGSVLTLGAGALFGVTTGSLAVSAGATLGATMAFLVGRYLARDWVTRRFIQGSAGFEAVDRAVSSKGFKVVVLTRLSPLFPFNMLNYAYGLTNVSLRDYFLASWLGMLPGTVMYVYIGSLASEALVAAGGEGQRTTGQVVLMVVGGLATVLVTLYVTRLARRELAKETDAAATAAQPEQASSGGA